MAGLIPRTHRLILVRHAESLVEPERSPRDWGLTAPGAGAAGRLAALGLFDRVAGYYAGPEPKMLQTLAPVAAAREAQVQPEPGFHETASAGWHSPEAFRDLVRRFFAGPEVAPAPGWEPAAQAAARCREAMGRLQLRHATTVHRGFAEPGTFAVASGGRLLMAYLASLLGLGGDEAFRRWRGLRMPDLALVELAPDTPAREVIPFGTLAV